MKIRGHLHFILESLNLWKMPLKIQILLHIDFRHLKIINVYLPLPEVVPHQTEHHLKKCVTCLTVWPRMRVGLVFSRGWQFHSFSRGYCLSQSKNRGQPLILGQKSRTKPYCEKCPYKMLNSKFVQSGSNSIKYIKMKNKQVCS